MTIRVWISLLIVSSWICACSPRREAQSPPAHSSPATETDVEATSSSENNTKSARPNSAAEPGRADKTARACAKGDAEACFEQGASEEIHINMMAPRGAHNPRCRRALEVYEKACGLEHCGGCSRVLGLWMGKKCGSDENRDQAVAKARKRTMAVCETSCETGEAQGCYQAGAVSMARGAADRARVFFQKAKNLFEDNCKKGSADACYSLGMMNRLGRGGPADPAAAAKWMARACDLSGTLGCL